ncbi:MAG: BamA/TamA family outer membrane protein [Betaproteobacteria bacterium]
MHPPLRFLRALILAAATLLAASAGAADPPSVAAAGGSATVVSAEPAYRVVIAAPPTLKAAIERSVGLVRWQSYSDMTVDLLERLSREARDETRNVAAAEGYFSAGIDITIDRDAKPPIVTITVTPGEPTRVAKVAIDVTGPAANDAPLGTAAIGKLRSDWGLPDGDVFRQSAWSVAKDRALATMHASPYAAARIARSEAAIDPEARTAVLAIDIESGPAFRFGDLAIEGLVKYPASIVRNYSSIRPGEPYGEAALEQFVRRLNSTGYFSSVQAAIDPVTAHPEDATVRVNVIEAPTKSFEGGIGYSTDVRYTAKASYRDVNIDGQGLQMLADAQYDGNIQGGSLRLVQPANSAGWIGTWVVGGKRTDIEGLATQTGIVGTRWYTLEERRERALSATYYLDNQEPSDAPSSRSHALYVEVEQYLREVDKLVAPTRGWMASAQVGGGIPGASTRGFGRAVGRFAAWVPLDSVSQLNFRGDIGAVFAPTRDGIPSTLLFRTGGDTTVRGYAFESLGVQQGNAVVGGRYYAVASVEAVRWIGENWGLAAFVDAGNATDSASDFKPALGYGTGVRIRTPLGPFRVDLAYGQQVHQVRLHFSVGLSF